jgi:hypothetical protein
MPSINVAVETTIAAEPSDIASVMFDPAREPQWISVVASVEILDRALAPGARVRRTANVFGREVSWTSQVEAVHFPHLLTLRVMAGPVVALLSYEIQRSAGGSIARIHARGEMPDLALVPVSIVESELHAMLTGDLARLKGLVEPP